MKARISIIFPAKSLMSEKLNTFLISASWIIARCSLISEGATGSSGVDARPLTA